MAKFKKALALVLSLAMVFTLAPIANVQTEAASKYKIKAATTAIAAGKTYNVKVTGVKKTQYVKVARSAGVTVKYNGKTIKASKKVAGTGKTLTFKVTVPDKVANYKSTIKPVIYNKKNNKKVKTLSTKRTVKVSEFSISSVVPTTQADAGKGHKYIRATFTKAIDSLDFSEVTIINKATGAIYSVEEVKLASNGKSADITLMGNVSGASTTFLQPNVDYILQITKAGATAELPFTIPRVAADRVVTAVDAAKKTITFDNNKYTIGDSVTVDYNEVLGRTITAEFDKNAVINKLTLNDEKVLYGTFTITKRETVNATNNMVTEIQDVATKDKYSVGYTTAGSIYAAEEITLDGNNNMMVGAQANVNTVEYAKVVLNGNGSVRSIVDLKAWSGYILVDTVGETSVKAGSTEVNLKDYNILKDGKTAAIADIQAGDVVFYNAAKKIALIYTQKVTGKVTAVYASTVVIGGTTYDYTSAKYVSGSVKDVDAAYLSSLKAAGEDAAVYVNMAGTAIFITGTTGAAETVSKTLVLTTQAVDASLGLDQKFTLRGYNPETKAIETYMVNIADIQTITNGATSKSVSGTTKATYNPATVATTISTATINEDDLDKLQVVDLTFTKDTNKLIGVGRSDSSKLVTVDGKSAPGAYDKFKKGAKNINGNKVAADVPVYVVEFDTVNAVESTKVSATTYGAMETAIDLGAARVATDDVATVEDIRIYAGGGSVSKIVILKEVDGNANASGNDKAFDGDDDKADPVVAVVGSYSASADTNSNNKTDSTITLITAAGEKTYTSFADKWDNTIADGDLAAGSVVSVVTNKANDKIVSIASLTPYATVAANAGKFTWGSDSAFQIGSVSYKKASDAIVVKVSDSGKSTAKAEIVGFAELNGEKHPVYAHLQANTSDNTADVVVLTDSAEISDAALSAYDAVQTVADALNPTIDKTNHVILGLKRTSDVKDSAGNGVTIAWTEDATYKTTTSPIGTFNATATTDLASAVTPTGSGNKSLLIATISCNGTSVVNRYVVATDGVDADTDTNDDDFTISKVDDAGYKAYVTGLETIDWDDDGTVDAAPLALTGVTVAFSSTGALVVNETTGAITMADATDVITMTISFNGYTETRTITIVSDGANIVDGDGAATTASL